MVKKSDCWSLREGSGNKMVMDTFALLRELKYFFLKKKKKDSHFSAGINFQHIYHRFSIE